MSNLREKLSNKMIPTHALIFFESSNRESGGAYVEHRRIANGAFGAGGPLKVKTLSKIMAVVNQYIKQQDSMVSLHGIIPENLLYSSSKAESVKLVWYRKPEKRMMYFSKNLEIPNGEVMIPGLVYVANGKNLSVYAFKGTKPKRILYKAPFFNVNEKVCLGTAKIKKPCESTFDNWIEYWEAMFWKSEFVHILGGNPIKGNLASVTKRCITTGEAFPINELIKTNVTLKDLLK